MKKRIKQIIKELVPNIVLRPFRFLIKDKSYPQVISEDISNLKEKYSLQLAQESVIIGNGPSLRDTLSNHLGFFKSKSLFCVNNFVDTEYFEIIKPTFYVLADPAYWNKNCSPNMKEYMTKIYSQLTKKVNWQMFLLLPITAREWNWFLNLASENSNIVLSYYNNNPSYENLENRHKLYKKNQAIPHLQNVLVASIFLSLNLGFKKNYLVGGDLSLHENIFVNNNNIVCNYDRHFYDKEEPTAVPFWKVEDESEVFKMDEIFLAFSRMFKGFWELEGYSKFLDAKIYNASYKSYIDAFERYDLEKITS